MHFIGKRRTRRAVGWAAFAGFGRTGHQRQGGRGEPSAPHDSLPPTATPTASNWAADPDQEPALPVPPVLDRIPTRLSRPAPGGRRRGKERPTSGSIIALIMRTMWLARAVVVGAVARVPIPCNSFDSLENVWKILGKVWKILGFSLELTLISLSELSLFNGLRRPLGPFFLSARFSRLGSAPRPPHRRPIKHACLAKRAADRRPLLTERSTIALFL